MVVLVVFLFRPKKEGAGDEKKTTQTDDKTSSKAVSSPGKIS